MKESIMYSQSINNGNKEIEETKKVWLVVDIDNNIAENSHRKHLIEGEKKDWDAFNAQALYDTPNTPLIQAIQDVAKNPDVKLLFITGRNNKEASKEATYTWLKNQGFNSPHVAFRGKKVFNPNNEIKVLNVSYFLARYELPEDFEIVVVEDSKKVLDSFESTLGQNFKLTTMLSDVSNGCKDVIKKLGELKNRLNYESENKIEKKHVKPKF